MKQKMNDLKRRWRAAPPVKRWGIGILSGAFMILVVFVIVKQVSVAREARDRRKILAAGPRVPVAVVQASPPQRTLVLVGEARPYETATLYAKISGYLKSVRVDKGDSVESGDLLAVIQSPETSQDYDGAVADARNKRAIADRLKPLLEKKLISQQEADQAFADADVSQSRAGSLGTLKGYQEIRAPFDGTITARFADPGALVQNAANSQTSALPLFQISNISRLRVYVYVDQGNAAFIRKGLPVHISLDERPDIQLEGAVTRFSGELDPKTRMLLAEVDVDNRKKQLVAGSFVKVMMSVQSASYPEVPSEAVVLRQGKDFIPVVSSSGTVEYRPVTIGDNDGEHVRLLKGVTIGETVALNLGNSIEEGARVQPIVVSSPAAPAATGAVSTSSAAVIASSSK